MTRHCECCGIEEPSEIKHPVDYFHNHHLVPKALGGEDTDGRILLCKKCHDKIHFMIPMFMWEFIDQNREHECQKYIKKKTLEMMRFKY